MIPENVTRPRKYTGPRDWAFGFFDKVFNNLEPVWHHYMHTYPFDINWEKAAQARLLQSKIRTLQMSICDVMDEYEKMMKECNEDQAQSRAVV